MIFLVLFGSENEFFLGVCDFFFAAMLWKKKLDEKFAFHVRKCPQAARFWDVWPKTYSYTSFWNWKKEANALKVKCLAIVKEFQTDVFLWAVFFDVHAQNFFLREKKMSEQAAWAC